MPPPKNMDTLLKVEEVNAMVTPNPPHIPILILEVEDGRTFTLYGVPYEIVLAINKLQNPSVERVGIDSRESLYDILLDFKEQVEQLGRLLGKVVIDELDYSAGLYSATAEFVLEGIIMRKRMIPSHAIFMALVFRKPIYVRKKLVDEQEEYEKQLAEEQALSEPEGKDDEEDDLFL